MVRMTSAPRVHNGRLEEDVRGVKRYSCMSGADKCVVFRKARAYLFLRNSPSAKAAHGSEVGVQLRKPILRAYTLSKYRRYR